MHELAPTSVSAAARWRVHVAAHERSGQSVRNYCEVHSLRPPTFYDWRRRLAARPAFTPVHVAPARAIADAGVEVVLSSGHRLRLSSGFAPDVLRAAVAALAGPLPC